MSYTPSEAAVEVLIDVLLDHEAVDMDECTCGWTHERDSVASHIAKAALVAFMGATVTEPCATCGGTGEGTSWIDHGASMDAGAPIRRTDPCLVCNGTGKVPEQCDACGGRGAIYMQGNYIADCDACPPSPRSLPVVECEAAGLLDIDDMLALWVDRGELHAYEVETADRNPHDPQARHFRTVYERQHRAAAPSTGSPT